MVKGGVKSSRMSFFRGVKVRVDEKWTWGEGGSIKAENGWTSFVHGPHAKEHEKLCPKMVLKVVIRCNSSI